MQLVFKLQFKNTNNTIEYEAFLLGISTEKKRGIKILQASGDTKLIVKKF